MSRAIPLSFLCHKATLLIPEEGEDLLDKSYRETRLSHVRVQLEDKVRLSGNNTVSTSAAVLYYDCRNSLPLGVEFDTSMRVNFAGKTCLMD